MYFDTVKPGSAWGTGRFLRDTLIAIMNNFTRLEPSVRTSTAADYAPVADDRVIRRTRGTAQTVTIPTNATVPFPIGWTIDAIQSGAGALTIAAAGGVTIEKLAAKTLVLSAQYGRVRLIKLDTNVWHLSGDLA